MAQTQKTGNAIEQLVEGAGAAFVTLILFAIMILALLGISEDLTFIDTNGSFFSDIKTSTQDGMVALGGIVLLVVVFVAFGFLRRRGII